MKSVVDEFDLIWQEFKYLSDMPLRPVHTDRSDSYSASDSDTGYTGMYSNIIGIGHFIWIGIGQCEWTVKHQCPIWVAVYHIIVCSGGRRKSNCVTEVEKIKAKREQRRAQQQAIREHVEETCDTSNPNWEFLQMIRYVSFNHFMYTGMFSFESAILKDLSALWKHCRLFHYINKQVTTLVRNKSCGP